MHLSELDFYLLSFEISVNWRSGLGFDDEASLPYAIGLSIFLAFFFMSFFECYIL